VPLPPVAVVQNAYVVPDLVAACHRMHELYRVGPFLRIDTYEMRDVLHRGAPVAEPIVIEAAFAQSGDIVIELIEQTSPGPSGYRDMYGPGEQGLHHIATLTHDYDAERQAFLDAGYELSMEMPGRSGDYMICYVDTRPVLGHMIELYPAERLEAAYTTIRECAADWDGAGDLIRPFPGQDRWIRT
jgi:Glyoxalase/Bleomycin resistance protein/Dioxygenase superfamily